MKQQANYNKKPLTLETLIRGRYQKKNNEEGYNEYKDYYLLYLLFLINGSVYKAKKYFDLLPAKVFLHYDWKELFKQEIVKTSEKILNEGEEIDLSFKFFYEVNKQNFIIVEEYRKEWFYSDEIEQELKKNSNYVQFISKLISQYHLSNYEYDDKYKYNEAEGVFNDRYKRFILAVDDFINDNYIERDEENPYEALLYKSFYNLDNYLIGVDDLSEVLALFYYLFFLKTTLKKGKLNLLQIETRLAGIIRWNIPLYDEYNSLTNSNLTSQKTTSFKSFSNVEELKKLHIFLVKGNYIKDVEFSIFQKVFNNTELMDSEKLEWQQSKKLLAYLINKLREKDYISISDNFWQKAEYCFKEQKANNLKSTFQDIKDFSLPKGYEAVDSFFN